MLKNAAGPAEAARTLFALRNATVGWNMDRWKVYFALPHRGAHQERRGELPGLPQQHREGRVRQRDRRRAPGDRGRGTAQAVQAEGAAQADRARQGVDDRRPRRAGSEAQERAELQERRAGVRRGAVRRLPPLRRRRRRDRPGPVASRRPVRPQGPGRGARRAEQGDLRPVQGVGRPHRSTSKTDHRQDRQRRERQVHHRHRPRGLDEGGRGEEGRRRRASSRRTSR